MWRILFLLLFTVSQSLANNISSATYTIITDGDTVGTLKLKSYYLKDTLVYEYVSDATVKFFGTHHVISKKVCKYLNGKMVYSYSLNTENGKKKDEVIMHWRGSYYDVHETGESFQQKEPVYYGTIRMFFEEPSTAVKQVFAEVKLDFQALSRIASGIYEADGGWGKGGKYYYTNGVLTKALIFSPVIDFELHRR